MREAEVVFPLYQILYEWPRNEQEHRYQEDATRYDTERLGAEKSSYKVEP